MSRDEVKSGCPTDKAGPRQNQSEFDLVKETVGLGRVRQGRTKDIVWQNRVKETIGLGRVRQGRTKDTAWQDE